MRHGPRSSASTGSPARRALRPAFAAIGSRSVGTSSRSTCAATAARAGMPWSLEQHPGICSSPSQRTRASGSGTASAGGSCSSYRRSLPGADRSRRPARLGALGTAPPRARAGRGGAARPVVRVNRRGGRRALCRRHRSSALRGAAQRGVTSASICGSRRRPARLRCYGHSPVVAASRGAPAGSAAPEAASRCRCS